jgi:hypothetical protein
MPHQQTQNAGGVSGYPASAFVLAKALGRWDDGPGGHAVVRNIATLRELSFMRCLRGRPYIAGTRDE